QQRRHGDHDERDAVDAERDVHSQRGYPVERRDLLEAFTARVVGQPRGHDQQQFHHGHGQRHQRCRSVVVAQPGHHEGTDERQQDQGNEPTHENLTNNSAATSRNDPPSIESAYDRTNPVCIRRNRLDPPPSTAASPFTAPSTPRLSRNTAKRVSHRPGLATNASFRALPYRSLRAARTGQDTFSGRSTGVGFLPNSAHANSTPSADSPTVSHGTNAGGSTPCSDSTSVPTEGTRNSASVLPDMSRKPAATEPTESTIIGTVITVGASCGWKARPSADVVLRHRSSPKNVSRTSRVM